MPENQSKIVPLLALFAKFEKGSFPCGRVAELGDEKIDFVFLDQVSVLLLHMMLLMGHSQSRVTAQGRRMLMLLHGLHLL